MLVILLVTQIVLSKSQNPSSNSYNVIYSWKDTLPVPLNTEVFRSTISSKRVPIGIKALDDKLIINIPRWSKRHHPINIAWLPRINDPIPSRVIENATVQPFPNWEMQKIGNCRSFQYVQSFEIEPSSGLMWMPDSGLEGINCPSKITILDGRSGQIVHQYLFPRDVAKAGSNFLNDIAIDVSNSNNKFAFISDSKEGKIIVYSLLKNKSWAIEHQSMKVDLRASTFDFLVPFRNRQRIIKDSNINGIAISPARTGSKMLYYRPLVSYDLFSMPTDLLKDENSSKRVTNSDVTKISDKSQTGQGDGMVVDENGYLYTAEVTKNTIIRWDLRNRIPEVLHQDNQTLIWGDTFAIDDDGFLWVTTRGWPIDSHNRIVRFKINAKSYLNKK
ncbi:dopaminechrome tautomerase [Lepeophtheirus salmonis]|uniref:Yellowx1c [Nasonia vitripennis] n=1 Tax=Lepeophtheirus salmonis TaxID=72036 RepID=A0A0K2T6X1_LEPSM|nr:protein yellow-like [Lepeophtheirus salmonis]